MIQFFSDETSVFARQTSVKNQTAEERRVINQKNLASLNEELKKKQLSTQSAESGIQIDARLSESQLTNENNLDEIFKQINKSDDDIGVKRMPSRSELPKSIIKSTGVVNQTSTLKELESEAPEEDDLALDAAYNKICRSDRFYAKPKEQLSPTKDRPSLRYRLLYR